MQYMKGDEVLVCYESNRQGLASETGFTTELVCVKQQFSDAAAWVMSRIKQGIKDGFTVDREALDGREINEASILKELADKGSISITMFFNGQENWLESYDIVVERHEVE